MDLPQIDMNAMKTKTAFVVGHTGAVGKQIVRVLLEKKLFKSVVLIGRRKVDFGDDPIYKDVVYSPQVVAVHFRSFRCKT
jgi:N-acetyl-gamma-glutamylphosphate reductase